jgi:hypothetical protein
MWRLALIKLVGCIGLPTQVCSILPKGLKTRGQSYQVLAIFYMQALVLYLSYRFDKLGAFNLACKVFKDCVFKRRYVKYAYLRTKLRSKLDKLL